MKNRFPFRMGKNMGIVFKNWTIENRIAIWCWYVHQKMSEKKTKIGEFSSKIFYGGWLIWPAFSLFFWQFEIESFCKILLLLFLPVLKLINIFFNNSKNCQWYIYIVNDIYILVYDVYRFCGNNSKYKVSKA